MRRGDFLEKRKYKRIELSIPVSIKSCAKDTKKQSQEGLTLNISYNGAYVVNVKNLKHNEEVNISIQIPKEEAGTFPMSRIAGRAKVVRMDDDGAGLEFDNDINRLFVAPN